MQMIDKLFSVQGQCAIITGAAGGLGSELTAILAQAGATVVCVDPNPTSLQALGQRLEQYNAKYHLHSCDVTQKDQITQLLNNLQQDGINIDILVNSAGVLGADDIMFNIEEQDWDKVMQVNLKGTWLFSTMVAKHMIEKQIAGRIVNISSSLGGRAQLRRIHYATSKAGVEHLTRNMAMELVKKNIRVNCLAPGWMATPMVQAILDGPDGARWKKAIPMGRAAQPCELSGALLLLASQASSYMTGSCLRVDGGYSYRGIECE